LLSTTPTTRRPKKILSMVFSSSESIKVRREKEGERVFKGWACGDLTGGGLNRVLAAGLGREGKKKKGIPARQESRPWARHLFRSARRDILCNRSQRKGKEEKRKKKGGGGGGRLHFWPWVYMGVFPASAGAVERTGKGRGRKRGKE